MNQIVLSPAVRSQKLAYSGGYPSLVDFVNPIKKSPSSRIAILTQDIFGPIRNAGIGTAYMHAATFLAQEGFDVTIVYTQGHVSHTQPISYWIDFYKERGVAFICAADQGAVQAPTPALRWSYNGFMQLKSMPSFDIVHSSECGASPYYSLLAKRNGGLFSNTQFCIKTSSPHLWSREGNENLISLDNGPIIAMAERYSVEQADLIIAPSCHMLDWMVEHGYHLPQNICVHPNIMPIPKVEAEDVSGHSDGPAKKQLAEKTLQADGAGSTGDVKDRASPAINAQKELDPTSLNAVDEIVFFGRLEPRKGIRLFSDAVALALPNFKRKPKITFLGKLRGDELDFNFESFMTEFVQTTQLETTAILDKDAAQAIAYLKGRGRVAVIPSLLDNSPFTVYEALIHKIPFIASDVGGIPELVHPGDRSRVLFPPRVKGLASALSTAVNEGVQLARISFDPTHSLGVWKKFHEGYSIPPLRTRAMSASTGKQNKRTLIPLAVFKFDESGPLPLVADQLQELAEKSNAEFIEISDTQFSMEAQSVQTLLHAMNENGGDVGIPVVQYHAAGQESTSVNFQPNMWNKIDFSRIATHAVFFKRSTLASVIQSIGEQKSIATTNVDELIAAATRMNRGVLLYPNLSGVYDGSPKWLFSRILRNRQVRLLTAGIPPDVANIFRVYCGLQDERTRLIAAQPVLGNVKRLLRILGRLRSHP